MMTCSLFLEVEKHGGEGRILTGNRWSSSGLDPGLFRLTEGLTEATELRAPLFSYSEVKCPFIRGIKIWLELKGEFHKIMIIFLLIEDGSIFLIINCLKVNSEQH